MRKTDLASGKQEEDWIGFILVDVTDGSMDPNRLLQQ